MNLERDALLHARRCASLRTLSRDVGFLEDSNHSAAQHCLALLVREVDRFFWKSVGLFFLIPCPTFVFGYGSCVTGHE